MSAQPPSSPADQDPTLHQLNRIKGQLEGIIKMYEERRSCVEITRQIVAARSSLGRVARDVLSCEAVQCTQERRLADLEEVLKEIFRYS